MHTRSLGLMYFHLTPLPVDWSIPKLDHAPAAAVAVVVSTVMSVAAVVPVRVAHRVVVVEAPGMENLDVPPAHVLPEVEGIHIIGRDAAAVSTEAGPDTFGMTPRALSSVRWGPPI